MRMLGFALALSSSAQLGTLLPFEDFAMSVSCALMVLTGISWVGARADW